MGQRLQAWSELASRYRIVFGHAWRHRADMAPPPRLPHEARFLPAALALQETPVHPLPRVTMAVLLVFAFLALLWSIIGQVDMVASAHGQIVPDSRSKVIQSIEAGTVRQIHVRDGQLVRANDTLLELDHTVARADVVRLEYELAATSREAMRYRLLLDMLAISDASDHDALAQALANLDEGDRKVLDESDLPLVIGSFSALTATMAQLDAEEMRREAEHRTVLARVEKLRETLPLIEQRARDYRDLSDKRFISRHRYLELEQVRIEQSRELAAMRESLHQMDAARAEVQRNRERLVAETRRDWLSRMQTTQERRVALNQELIKAARRDEAMLLAAPVDGVVQQLGVHTLGGVVTPAQPLMVIVPLDNPLEIEALVSNRDIGFVFPGQSVEVKVDTFPFTKYGTLEGEIISVSPDAIQHDVHGPVFVARVRLAGDRLQVDERIVPLSPGMTVVVEIRTGQRRLIEYFLGPLLKYADESLRER